MKNRLLPFVFLFVVTSLLCQAQDPTLWGMTSVGGNVGRPGGLVGGAGTIFNYDIYAGFESDIYNFIDSGTDTGGQNPNGSLIQANNGLLYGMTLLGGLNNEGIIFGYNISADSETLLHNFGSNTDGFWPFGSLIQANDSLLYGMAQMGGSDRGGIIFSYNISKDIYTDIHDFGSGIDEVNPDGSLIQANNGLLYGLTQEGGTYDKGIIFSYNISTDTEIVLYNFGKGTDGAYPLGSLIQANNGFLYGMTQFGGTNYSGTIFSYNILTSTESVLHNFGNDNDGYNPYGSLIQASDNLLYGMTPYGGAYGAFHGGNGVIFSYNISTSIETVLHSFGNGSDEYWPYGSLIQASNGLLYGMTETGGAANLFDGTIFSYDISDGTETNIYDFQGNGTGTGGAPWGDLIETGVSTNITQLPTVNNQLSIYPNPTSNIIHLTLTLQQQQPTQLILYNILGQQVWAEDLGTIKQTEATIPVIDLTNGVYILKVNTGGVWQQKEIVVTR